MVMMTVEVHFLLPTWKSVTLADLGINFNMLRYPIQSRMLPVILEHGEAVFSEVEDWSTYGPMLEATLVDYYSFLLETRFDDPNATYQGEPVNIMNFPVFDKFGAGHKVVAILSATVYWEALFWNILPPDAPGVVGIVRNSCGDVFTYEVIGINAIFLGKGDYHDIDFDYLKREFKLTVGTGKHGTGGSVTTLNEDYCPYILTLYPSDILHQNNFTRGPLIYAGSVLMVFLFAAIVSLTYDWITQRRLRRIVKTEQKARAVVTSIFPKAVQERLLKKQDGGENQGLAFHPKVRLKSFLDTPKVEETPARLEEDDILTEKPIADLFPYCTVLFADISGFSAWSSEREPEQVFTLLENVFQTFDKLARRRNVFKVETVGDSYVAVTGLTDPQPDHAIRMARFAKDFTRSTRACVDRSNYTVKNSINQGRYCRRG